MIPSNYQTLMTNLWQEIKFNNMKKIGITLLFVGLSLFSSAQNETVETPQNSDPTYVGGQEAMTKHISTNLRYPEDAVKSKTQGTVYASITINEEGRVIDVKILRGVSESIDLEATRVIKIMPNWKPAISAEGKPITSRVSLPIKFALN